MKQIRRILIANRGEIAVRIIKTCREMNIRTIALYSDVDRDAPHVRLADEAYSLGAPIASESYLNKEKILAIAKSARADAIHPGYGFLSENYEFAQQVNDAGLVFIGPSPRSMALMGSKTSARRLAQSLGVPIVPGSPDALDSNDEAALIADQIGYPVLLKASGGGGGKGMRVIRTASELPSGLASARSEARSAFGDDRVYVEKYIENPRHIEVQILGDSHGNVIHLGERECSIQRRHQKIIEESPSCALDQLLRQSLTNAAVSLARASEYTNAGTIEFILDAEKNFYFLEMNTRLQVEHPVTEMRTGLDLVREQIRIAEGNVLSLDQQAVTFSGHAIECRIYAEDSFNNFFPFPGQIIYLRSPSGIGIREERGVEEGSAISTHYDPMIAKLIAWAHDRDEALDRMSAALNQYEIFGVKNNVDLCLWIVNHPEFRAGKFDTHFLSRNFTKDSLGKPEEYLLEAASLVAALCEQHELRPQQPPAKREIVSEWKAQRSNFMR